MFAQAGRKVTLHERSDAAMLQSTSHWAGGMLAPYCEAEVSEPVIVRLGLRSLDLWREQLPETPFNGSLVVAHPRDRADFDRFAKLTSGHRRLDAAAMAEIEPALEGRFRDGLYYPEEGHVEPRRVLPQLHARLTEAGGTIRFDSDVTPEDCDGIVIDCRGLAARDTQPELRGVKGEMIIVETGEIEFSRPVRLIHPRWPLYIIPRADHQFMIGATSIEAEDRGVSVRSALELLERRLCGASGVCRSPHRRIRLRPAAGLSRQSAAHRDSGRQNLRQRTLSPRLPAGAGAGGTDARLCRARRDRQRGDAMRVIVNGEQREIASARVDALLGELEYEGTHFAIALNFDVLPKSRWAETALKSGDEIEIITPRQGG